MALDAFSVVLGFLAAVEVLLGAAAAVLGWREFRGGAAEAAEGRRPLLVLVAVAAVAAAVLAFPLHHLLLSSWVPRWPGIMCVEGVRRIGTGTVGASRFLPWIVQALDFTRILVIFAAGSWAILRRVPGAAGPRRAAVAAILLGALAALDGALGLAYVAMPKEEILPVAGCCTAAPSGPERHAGLTAAGGGEGGSGVAAAHVAAAALLGAGALALRGRPARFVLGPLAAGSLLLAGRFLADVAAPAVLGLPYHRCAWCAFAAAPETVVFAVLHLGGALCAGWSAWAADGGRRLLAASAFGFLASAAMGGVFAWAL